jgi:hypothetical protein
VGPSCVPASAADVGGVGGPVPGGDGAFDDYVSSLADHYQPRAARPWRDVAEDVREQVQAVINAEGEFRTAGDVAAIVCR